MKLLYVLLSLCLITPSAFAQVPNKPVHIRYANEINGYKIEVLWNPEYFEHWFALTGLADITLTDASGASCTITDCYFGFFRHEAPEIIMELHGIDTDKEVNITGVGKNELLLEDSKGSFFFEDINFDGKKDFVTVFFDEGGSFRNGHYAYDLPEKLGPTSKAIPFSEKGLDCLYSTGVFDEVNKTITNYHKSSATIYTVTSTGHFIANLHYSDHYDYETTYYTNGQTRYYLDGGRGHDHSGIVESCFRVFQILGNVTIAVPRFETLAAPFR